MTLDTFYERNALLHIIHVFSLTGFTVGMMFSLTAFKYSTRRILTLFGLYLVWVSLSTGLIVHYFGYYIFGRVMFFTVSVPGMVLAYCLDSNSSAQTVFNYVTQLNISVIIAITILLVNTAINGNPFTYFAILSLLYSFVIWLEYRFIRQPFLGLGHMGRITWGALLIIPLTFSGLLFLIINVPVYYVQDPIRTIYVYGILLLMTVVYFIIYQNVLKQYQLQLVTHDKEILTLQISSMEKQAKNVLASEERLKILRHDIRHFAIVMQSCLQDGSMEDARHLLSGLEDALVKSEIPHYCDNYMINSVLAYYLDLAKEEGIQVHTVFTAPPKDIVDSSSFSVVLANALENALNACRSESGERYIKLKSRMIGSQYLMELANTCSKEIKFDEEGLPVSRNGVEHGIGTKSILSFARQMRSNVNFRQDNGMFILQMITYKRQKAGKPNPDSRPCG